MGDVPDAVVAATLADIGMNIGNLWCRKSLNSPERDKVRLKSIWSPTQMRCCVFVQYRGIIFSVFASKKKVKKSDVVAAVQTALKDEVPDSIYAQLMKEFAVYDKGALSLRSVFELSLCSLAGLWVLKTGSYNVTD